MSRGDETAMDRISTTTRILAEFEFPYLAHTPMRVFEYSGSMEMSRSIVASQWRRS